jgi:hypothetical protein
MIRMLVGCGWRSVRRRVEPFVVMNEINIRFHVLPASLNAVVRVALLRSHLAELLLHPAHNVVGQFRGRGRPAFRRAAAGAGSTGAATETEKDTVAIALTVPARLDADQVE